MQAAFLAAKAALAAASQLDFPASGAALSLVTDASATHAGAVLQQRCHGEAWRPLGFFSAKLDPPQRNYSAFDRELLAMYLAIRHFRFMLEGRRFTIFTDHRPLLGALGRVSEPWTARQQRQLAFVAEYTADIHLISGQSNVVADALSRPADAAPPAAQPAGATYQKSGHSATAAAVPPVPAAAAASINSIGASSPPSPAATSPPLLVDLSQLAAAQVTCTDCQRGKSSTALRVLEVAIGGQNVLVDVSSDVFRPLVPAAFRRQIFSSIHGLAHPGIRATRRLVASRFVWPNLAADIKSWCQDCQQCQAAKVTKQLAAPVHSIPVPATRFFHLHIDLVGPLPATAGGYTHLLTIVDRSTRWAEAVPLRSTAAAACLDAVIGTWIARFGLPATITTDRGTQFTSGTWNNALRRLGIQHVLTSAYHPQSNGLVERFHRRLKEAAWLAPNGRHICPGCC
jgi:RNase H-like domain found in reverse transcriptase/Integrase zinc binding domain/Integrase core domain